MRVITAMSKMRIYILSKMRSLRAMIDVREFLDLIGRDEIVRRFGFRTQDISRSVRDGLFPAGWYPFIRELCIERGIETPDHLFRWSKVPGGLPAGTTEDAA